MATSTGVGSGKTQAPPGRRVALALLVLVGVVFVAVSWSRLTGVFGDSDEGINGAVWAYSSRSLRELGPLQSALGGRLLDGSRYATHPPLIVLETAGAELVAGEHPMVSRAPAWVGSLVAVALLYRILRRAGFEPLVAAAGTAVACGSPLFVVYGGMLDTPVTAFPLALGVVLVWQSSWARVSGGAGLADRRPAFALAVLLTGLAALASWQGGLLGVLAASALALRGVRRRPGAGRAALPYLIGAAVGSGLAVAWSWWAEGGLQALTDKLTRRSGSAASVGVGDVISFQIPWLVQLLGLATIGVVGCAIALGDRRLRPLAALSLGVVAGYALAFREAAAGHQYWCYWAVLPAAVGAAYLARLALDKVHSTRGAPRSALTEALVVAAVVVALMAVDLARPSRAAELIDEGRDVAALIGNAPPTAAGAPVWYVGTPYRPDFWIRYNTGRQALWITGRGDLDRAVADNPRQPVLLLPPCDASDPGYETCRLVAGDDRTPRTVPAGQLSQTWP